MKQAMDQGLRCNKGSEEQEGARSGGASAGWGGYLEMRPEGLSRASYQGLWRFGKVWNVFIWHKALFRKQRNDILNFLKSL